MAELTSAEGADGEVTLARDETGTLVITLSGEIDLSNVERFAGVMSEIAPGEEHLVFDLSDLVFLDSSGLALVLAAAVRARHTTLRDASPLIRRIVEATGLTEAVKLEP
jgi:anti-anti-sigma factor